MKLITKGRIAAATSLVTIVLIAAAIAWANSEVEDATAQRQHTTAIAQRLSELRLVTFEYLLARHERARQQHREVSQRLDQLLAQNPFAGSPQQTEILAHLRERNATTQRMFAELLASPGTAGPDARENDAVRRFEAQVSSQLLIMQQENLTDAFRLTEYATERINEAQRRVVAVIVAGLALIAAIIGGAAWLLHRDVVVPISRLEQATREVAAGNWSFQLDTSRDDEIGQLARHFNGMTVSLRDSFAQIERSNQELGALNREIEAFSYSVSHDLRAPLRSMDGFSLALLEDYGDKLGKDAHDSLHRIRAASQRMGRLIDELLRLSRVTRTELALRPVQLSTMVREIAEGLEQQNPGRPVRWEIQEGLTVQADRALIHIALQNLLENAWKFTGKTEKPVIRVGALERDGGKDYFVADNGVGFDMQYADRLFGAFQRMHHESEFPGTGIGLAIVQRVFGRHGGRIWAEARPGSGATFFFSLKDMNHERSEQGHPAG